MWRLGGLGNSARPVINPFAKMQTYHMFAVHLPNPVKSAIKDDHRKHARHFHPAAKSEPFCL